MGEMKNTDASYRAVMGSYARALGPGVKWHANIIWMDSESNKMMSNNAKGATVDLNDAGTDIVVTPPVAATERYTDQSENTGMALVTGIKVVF